MNIASLAAALIFTFFTMSGDLNDAKKDISTKYGSAQEVSVQTVGDQSSETWWYFSQGKCITFKHWNSMDRYYEVSVYEFEPVANNEPAAMEKAKKAAKLVKTDLVTN